MVVKVLLLLVSVLVALVLELVGDLLGGIVEVVWYWIKRGLGLKPRAPWDEKVEDHELVSIAYWMQRQKDSNQHRQ